MFPHLPGVPHLHVDRPLVYKEGIILHINYQFIYLPFILVYFPYPRLYLDKRYTKKTYLIIGNNAPRN